MERGIVRVLVCCFAGLKIPVFSKHSHPARGIRLYAQHFIIHIGIPVIIVSMDYEGHYFQYLMGHGDDGPFVPAA